MKTCTRCEGHGHYIAESLASVDCYACNGQGEIEDESEIRFAALQEAIRITGYRESGSELADTMAGRARPVVVDLEYRRQCLRRGVTP